MLDNLTPPKRKKSTSSRCRMGKIMATLDQSDQDILTKALADTATWTTHGLWVALTERGMDIGYTSVYRHRAGYCPCEVTNA